MATSRVRIKLNHGEIEKMLNGEGPYAGVAEDLERRAHAIADEAGPGMEVEEGGSDSRARYVVITRTYDAMLAEAKDRTLSRALDAGRG